MTKSSPSGVRNSDIVANEIRRLHDDVGLSFWQIASTSPWEGIPPGTLCAVYHGEIRMPNKYCEQVGMNKIVKVPANMVRKTTPSASPDKRHRRAINLSDAESAARTIRSAGTTAEYRRRLAALLLDEFQDDAR